MKYGIKIGLVALMAAVIIILAAGCIDSTADTPPAPGADGEEVAESGDLPAVTDMAGRTVEVPENVDRVLGLSATNRFFVYLDAEDMMTGVREMEQREPLQMPWTLAVSSKIKDLPIYDEGDLETIIALDPDVIFRCQNVNDVDIQDEESIQSRSNIPVVITRPYVSLSANKEEFKDTLKIFGEILGREKRAEELIQGIDEIIDDLQERTAGIPEEEKPLVYVGGKAWAGAHGITSTSSKYSAFEFINAHNAAADLGLENAFIDPEALLSWDPDIIFIESNGLELSLEDLKNPEFQQLRAVKNDEVHRIFFKIYNNTNFENVLINAYYIGSIIYPDRFDDVDISEKADEIYELFLGEPLYEEAARRYGEHSRIEMP